MSPIRIEYGSQARKFIEKLDRKQQVLVLDAIEELAASGEPEKHRKVKKLVGEDYGYRLEVKEYRVLFDFENTRLLIQVFRVDHRKQVYRR